MAARKSLGGAGLPPLADLFSTSEERALEAQTQERVMMLPVSELHDFPGHPFQVRDDEEMEKLAESITQHGVLMPGLVRPRAAGGYEIVAGHRRVPFPVSWTVKMKKKQKETQDILSYHTQAAGCSDKARAKASGGRQPIEECGRTGL